MAEFASLHDWLRRGDAPPDPIVTCDEPPAPEIDDEDAYEDLCSEMRRFRAALLDALACASEGERAELRVRCGTIDTRIDLDARELCKRIG